MFCVVSKNSTQLIFEKLPLHGLCRFSTFHRIQIITVQRIADLQCLPCLVFQTSSRRHRNTPAVSPDNDFCLVLYSLFGGLHEWCMLASPSSVTNETSLARAPAQAAVQAPAASNQLIEIKAVGEPEVTGSNKCKCKSLPSCAD